MTKKQQAEAEAAAKQLAQAIRQEALGGRVNLGQIVDRPDSVTVAIWPTEGQTDVGKVRVTVDLDSARIPIDVASNGHGLAATTAAVYTALRRCPITSHINTRQLNAVDTARADEVFTALPDFGDQELNSLFLNLFLHLINGEKEEALGAHGVLRQYLAALRRSVNAEMDARLAQAEERAATANSRVTELERQLAAKGTESESRQTEIRRLQGVLDEKQRELNGLNSRLQHLERQKGRIQADVEQLGERLGQTTSEKERIDERMRLLTEHLPMALASLIDLVDERLSRGYRELQSQVSELRERDPEALWQELTQRTRGFIDKTEPPVEQPAQPRKTGDHPRGGWSRSLLEAAAGLPLCALLDEPMFIDLLRPSRLERLENFLRYAEAGADVQWLLERCPPGGKVDVDTCFDSFKQVLDSADMPYAVGPLKRSFATILASLPSSLDRSVSKSLEKLLRARRECFSWED
ncbi:hypothetical protein HY374_01870 [Candidatus Berkelbacteria bacterium]|nr:hypothetical protein [Candidatus Berkelbacteria bacterium]